MHNAIPLSLAVLVSVAIIVIGCFYLTSPQRILGGFGLKPPAPKRLMPWSQAVNRGSNPGWGDEMRRLVSTE